MAQTSYPDPPDALVGIANNKVSTIQNLHQSTILDEAEIRTVVFALQKDSSSGLDGLSGSFFTATWHITSPLSDQGSAEFLPLW